MQSLTALCLFVCVVTGGWVMRMQAARKRPALADMLSHRWLQPPTAPAVSASPAASQSTPQLAGQSPPLLTLPGSPSSAAPSPPGPSPLGLTPTEAPGIQPLTPHSDEGRQPPGVADADASSEETSMSLEPMAAHSDTRLVMT